ncbi:MAG: hypothetical protein Q4P66_08495 [Actinomycetaceae bacterium]|nr:hypothetical protein [Actinomycetaceae bacterium]
MTLDPSLTSEQLYALAMQRTDLLSEIKEHPNCYPELREWAETHEVQLLEQTPQTNADTRAYKTGYPGAQSLATPDVPVPTPSKTVQLPHNAPKEPRSKIVTALVVSVVIASLIATGLWVTVFINKGKASYGYGALVANVRPIPEDGAVIASAAAKDTTYSIVLVNNDDSEKPIPQAHIIEMREGKKEAAIKAKLAKPMPQILANPYRVLCDSVDGLACPHAQTPKKKHLSIQFDHDTQFTWNGKNNHWVCNGQTFEARYLFGVIEGYVIASSSDGTVVNVTSEGEDDDATGDTQPPSIETPVDSISAFELGTGKVAWKQELDRSGFVTVTDSSITVIDAATTNGDSQSQGDDTTDVFTQQQLGTDELTQEQALARAEALIENADDGQIYELVPAKKEQANNQSASPSTREVSEDESPQQETDAIRRFDFRNAEFVIHHFEQGDNIPVQLQDGVASTPDNNYGEDDVRIDVTNLNNRDAPEGEDILYGDLNGDGYEDALVALQVLWGNNYSISYYAWMWDPSTGEPHQVPNSAFGSLRCNTWMINPQIEEDGSVTFEEKEMQEGDYCAVGPSGSQMKRIIYDEQTDSFFPADY